MASFPAQRSPAILRVESLDAGDRQIRVEMPVIPYSLCESQFFPPENSTAQGFFFSLGLLIKIRANECVGSDIW